MLLYLCDDIKAHLRPELPFFQQMMALEGEIFRDMDGRRTQRVRLGEKYYFIKQHTGVGYCEIIKNLIQGRLPIVSAKNEWQAIHALEKLNIRVPRVVAYGLKGANPATLQSFILMEELKDKISLETLSLQWQSHVPPVRLKRRLIAEVAHIANVLHQNGINHRDFYLCHFLLDTIATDYSLEKSTQSMLTLIDLHRATVRHFLPERWIVKDLAGLYFSSKGAGLTQRDLYRFMRAYEQKSLRQVLNVRKSTIWQKVKMRGEKLYRNHS